MNTNKLYLFYNGWSHKIGKIRRINTKTVTMDTGDKFDIDKLSNELQELTEKEERIYKGELIKKLSDNSRYSLKELLYVLEKTHMYLKDCDFLEVDTNKLQKHIDEMADKIKKETDLLIMEIKGEKFKLDENTYCKELIKIK